MKKTYISPVMDVIEIEKQTLLAGSDLGNNGSTDATSGNLAPEFFFDDED